MHFERQSKNNANVCALLFQFPRVNVVLSKPSVRQEDFEHKAQKEAEKENQEHRQSNVPSTFRMNQAAGRYSYQCSIIIFDLYIKILSKERIKLFKHCFLLLLSIHFAASEYGHRRQNLRNGDTSCRNKAIGKGLSNEFLCFLRT